MMEMVLRGLGKAIIMSRRWVMEGCLRTVGVMQLLPLSMSLRLILQEGVEIQEVLSRCFSGKTSSMFSL